MVTGAGAAPLCPATSPVPVAPWDIINTRYQKRRPNASHPARPETSNGQVVQCHSTAGAALTYSMISICSVNTERSNLVALCKNGPTPMKIALQDIAVQSVGDPGPTCFSRSLVKHRCRRAVSAFAIVGDLFCPGRGAGAFSFFGICSPLPPATRSPSEPASQPSEREFCFFRLTYQQTARRSPTEERGLAAAAAASLRFPPQSA